MMKEKERLTDLALKISIVLAFCPLAFFILSCTFSQSTISSAQNSLITLEVKDSNLSDVFKWIADQMNLDLAPLSSIYLNNTTITMHPQNQPAYEVLNHLCDQFSCSWSIVNNQLVIRQLQ